MYSRSSFFASLFIFLLTALALAGCSFEAGERTQLAGQECMDDGQCVEGLVCVERRCRPEGVIPTADAGAGDTDTPDNNTPDADAPDDVPMLDTGVDAGTPTCTGGESRCNGNTAEICSNGEFTVIEQCSDTEICDDASCVPVDPDICTRQDQICNEEGYNNGYWCGDLSESGGELRCLGVCDRSADDPNATCPEPGSVCAFGDGDQAVCLSGCALDEGCADDGLGCLPFDGQTTEGLCVPTNEANQVGDSCDPDNTFDCEAGAFCMSLQQGARCVEGCRPYTRAFDDGTDCSAGHCVPLSDTIGMCRPDAGNSTPGESCRQRHIFRACNQDATGCFPTGDFDGPQCSRFCRLAEGDTDCANGRSCVRYDQDRDDVGICQ